MTYILKTLDLTQPEEQSDLKTTFKKRGRKKKTVPNELVEKAKVKKESLQE